MQSPYPHLFRPGRIGRMEIRNRIVMSPMGTNYASDTGGVTERMIRHYAGRTRRHRLHHRGKHHRAASAGAGHGGEGDGGAVGFVGAGRRADRLGGAVPSDFPEGANVGVFFRY